MVMRISKMDMFDKKLEAKRLYIIKDLTASDVSKLIGISEKSIGAWVKKHNWKAEKEKRLNERLATEYDKETLKYQVVNEFRIYLKEQYPDLVNKIDEAINGYLRTK